MIDNSQTRQLMSANCRQEEAGRELEFGTGHDCGRIVFEGAPADLIAARSTLTGQYLAA